MRQPLCRAPFAFSLADICDLLIAMGSDFFRRLRTFLILGRVSNLPTVWSNCLAGWWLGGGGAAPKLPPLFSGVTLLYLGGMFLNDAFDVEFDRQQRKERPIPSGAISLRAVWRLGFALIAAGLIVLFLNGPSPGVLGVMLALGIILYDAVHKRFPLSPVLMGLCRFFVYLIAATTGLFGVTGRAIWCALTLAAYVVGLSFLARRESARGPAQYWPVMLLVTPIMLALLMNVGAYRQPALWLSLVLAMWVARCLRTTFWANAVNIGRTVSGLLAGIVFVDWLAVGPTAQFPQWLNVTFLVLFGAALVLQRFVPAT
jgi:hypothetical protein